MKIFYNDEKFPLKKIKNRLSKICKTVIDELGETTKVEVCISTVDEAEIERLNFEFRKKKAVTDVLSFPATNIRVGERFDFARDAEYINPETRNISLGDIVICADRAELQAREFGHSPEIEILRLVLHSLLHLFGFDHERDEDFEKMRAKELKIWSRLGYNIDI